MALRIGKKALGTCLDGFGFGVSHRRRPGRRDPRTPGALEDLGRHQPGHHLLRVGRGRHSHASGFGPAVPLQSWRVRLQPHVEQEVRNPDRPSFEGQAHKVVGRPVTAAVAKKVLEMLTGVVTKGTGKKNARIPGYIVAGGLSPAPPRSASTAAIRVVVTSGQFLGCVPHEDPQIVILVKIEEPQGIYFCGVVAAPVFARVGQEAL